MAGDTISTIAIIGNNAISQAIVNSLPSYELHLLLPLSTTLTNDPDLSHIKCTTLDFRSLQSITTAYKALDPLPDLVISNHHGGDFALQKRIVNAAVEAGIKRFMPAEFSHDSVNPAVQSLLPPHAERARLIEYLRQQSLVQWIGLATGYPVDSRLGDGHMGLDLKWQSATVYGTGDASFAASTASFVGDAVASLIRNWGGFQNQYICVAGMSTSLNEIIRRLESEQGSKWTVVYVEEEKCAEEAQQRMERGWPDAGMFLMERAALNDLAISQGFKRDAHVKDAVGLPSEQLGNTLQKIMHDVKHHKGGCDCA